MILRDAIASNGPNAKFADRAALFVLGLLGPVLPVVLPNSPGGYLSLLVVATTIWTALRQEWADDYWRGLGVGLVVRVAAGLFVLS